MLYLFVFLLGLLSLKVDGQQANKVSLGVYYETLCPDSIAFINNQLYPTVQSIGGQNIDLNLVPFGKASWTESGSTLAFTCHHGPNECKGNTVQACAKSKLGADDLMKFVYCMQKSQAPNLAGKSCAQQGGLDYTSIENCSNGSEGAQLLKAQGVATKALNPPATTFPWITINNQHTPNIQNRAVTDLKGLLCDSFPASATKPSSCNK